MLAALLLCDAGPGGPAWKVGDVADVTSRSIEHLKKRVPNRRRMSPLPVMDNLNTQNIASRYEAFYRDDFPRPTDS